MPQQPGKKPEHILSVERADRYSSPVRGRSWAGRAKDKVSRLATPTTEPEPAPELEDETPRWQIWVYVGTLLVVGFGFGLTMAAPEGMPHPWDRIGEIAGWMYFAAWSLSFYPQVYSNWSRKSVVGFSFDFGVLNTLGFACLSIYYCFFFWDSSVRTEYREANHGADNAVRANDVFFALHAFLLTSFTLVQVAIYERGSQRVSTPCRYICGGLIAAIAVYAILLATIPHGVSALSFLYFLSYVKLGITVSKYIPQAWLNYRRKSTSGWNVGQVILDLTGGILSLFQLCLEAIVLREPSLVTGDPVKLGLSLVSIGYDSLLIYQHYGLYFHVHDKIAALPGRDSGIESGLPEDAEARALLPDQSEAPR